MKKKILIVEDDSTLSKALVERFSHQGIEMIAAENGKIGLELALKEHPDLILADIVMPVMDGMTMLNELRKDEWGKNAPVIVLTNLYDDARISKSIESSASDYLIKADWSIEDLLGKVCEKLDIK